MKWRSFMDIDANRNVCVTGSGTGSRWWQTFWAPKSLNMTWSILYAVLLVGLFIFVLMYNVKTQNSTTCRPIWKKRQNRRPTPTPGSRTLSSEMWWKIMWWCQNFGWVMPWNIQIMIIFSHLNDYKVRLEAVNVMIKVCIHSLRF